MKQKEPLCQERNRMEAKMKYCKMHCFAFIFMCLTNISHFINCGKVAYMYSKGMKKKCQERNEMESKMKHCKMRC